MSILGRKKSCDESELVRPAATQPANFCTNANVVLMNDSSDYLFRISHREAPLKLVVLQSTCQLFRIFIVADPNHPSLNLAALAEDGYPHSLTLRALIGKGF